MTFRSRSQLKYRALGMFALIAALGPASAHAQTCAELSSLIGQNDFRDLAASELHETQISRQIVTLRGAAKPLLTDFHNCSFYRNEGPSEVITTYSCDTKTSLADRAWDDVAIGDVANKIRPCLVGWTEQPENVVRGNNSVFMLARNGTTIGLSRRYDGPRHVS